MCGCDFLDADDVREMRSYLTTCKPVVVVMVPPCRGMAGWGPFNKLVNNEAWRRSVAVSIPLGTLCGKVALHQLSVGLHFFNEHPVRSALYRLPPWKRVAQHPRTVTVVWDLCMTGLRSSTTGLPMQKPSEAWASHERLLWRQRRATGGLP